MGKESVIPRRTQGQQERLEARELVGGGIIRALYRLLMFGRQNLIFAQEGAIAMGNLLRRSGDDRRTASERRAGTGTRPQQEKLLKGERRSGNDPRSEKDRRSND